MHVCLHGHDCGHVCVLCVWDDDDGDDDGDDGDDDGDDDDDNDDDDAPVCNIWMNIELCMPAYMFAKMYGPSRRQRSSLSEVDEYTAYVTCWRD